MIRQKSQLPTNLFLQKEVTLNSSLVCQPVGYYHSVHTEKYMLPKQASLALEGEGVVILEKLQNIEQALEDLEGFTKIWLIYWFHKNSHWKPKVITPRGSKRGVFATRSPHRPNPIGISAVDLLAVEGRTIHVGKCDLLDSTPILDIKPYLTYADAHINCKHGWVDEEPEMHYEVIWLELALKQAQFIESGFPQLTSIAELRLSSNPFPFPSHRIKQIDVDAYELAVKTWRLRYQVVQQQVIIKEIVSGYDLETLTGKKTSRWNDVPLHVAFCEIYP